MAPTSSQITIYQVHIAFVQLGRSYLPGCNFLLVKRLCVPTTMPNVLFPIKMLKPEVKYG